ncbi:hypothetical protein PIB30_072548, partial [Stylosanthes scabra]|nr:hypothetical protein [Stylosanthes scabra]
MGFSNVKVKNPPLNPKKKEKDLSQRTLLKVLLTKAFPRQRRQKLDAKNPYDSQQSDKYIGSSSTTKEWVSFPRGK